ncbi:MAG: LamG-like jellyroll fold domain-containing protein, partial [Verrucomicrobiota bacterium]
VPRDGETGINLASNGHYLVLYNLAVRSDSTVNNERKEINANLELAGTDLPWGWSQGFIRQLSSDANTAAFFGGAAVIDANAGDVLQIEVQRTDSSTIGTVTRRTNESGVCVLKLDDSWAYARLSLANAVNEQDFSAATWSNMIWDTANELDAGYTHNNGAITLEQIGHYLVTYNLHFRQNGSTARRSMLTKLQLGGADLQGSQVSVYLRGSQSAIDGAAAWAGIIETSASNQVLRLQAREEDGGGNIDSEFGRCGITIVKLPDNADYIRLDELSGNQALDTTGPITWDNTLEEDPVGFSHTPGVNESRVTIQRRGDYLFFASLRSDDRAAPNNTRHFGRLRWQTNGTDIAWGQFGRYNRGNVKQYAGNAGGAILPGLSSGEYIELYGNNQGNTADAQYVYPEDDMGLQGVRLASLFSVPTPPTIDNTAASSITVNSAFLNGSLSSTGSAATTVCVFWGTADGGTNASSWANTNCFGVNAAAPPVPYATSITGLAQNTTYYYRYQAVNAAGTNWAPATTNFTTPLLPGVNNSSGADPIGIGEATLNGHLSTGGPARVIFFWGESDAGTSTNLWDNFIDFGTTNNGPVSFTVSNLLYGVQYYYRTYASNANGLAWANTTTNFKTLNPFAPNRLKITTCGYDKGETLSNFPLLVALSTNITGFSYAGFLSTNGYDLRLWNSNETVALNYEIDLWNPNGTSYVWVQVADLVDTGTCIWATWGDPAAADQESYTTNGATWSQDYVGVWHLNDDAGSGTFPDAVSNNDAADNSGSDTATSGGVIGEGQTFDGNSDELLIANESNFDQTADLSVSAWFTVDAYDTSWQALIAKGEGNEWRLHRNGGGNTLNWSANGNVNATSALDDGEWHHVQVNKSTTSGLDIYIDGVLETANAAATGAIALNDEQVRIGENPDSQGREWEGRIDEVRIMDQTR